MVGGTSRVVHERSRGAMGVVYRGEDLGLGRPVAIKVLRSDLASDRDLVSRFRAEAGLLASLHHPNLVQAYPLQDRRGSLLGVVYAGLDLSWLNQLVSATSLPPGSSLTVYDSELRVAVSDHPGNSY